MKDKPPARSSERSAACSICGKTFARSDTLLRHEKNHHSTDARGPVHRVTDGTFRACQPCATARSRCSGGAPCGRCKVRSLECIYPNKRRKALSSFDTNLATGESHGQPPGGSFGEIVFAAHDPGQQHGENQINGGTSSTVPPSSRPQPAGSSILLPDQAFDHQAGIGINGATFNVHPINEPAQMLQNDHYGFNATVPSHDSAFDGVKSAFDYSPFDEPLNWIPPSIYPSPYDAELEHDFAFILPTLSETAQFDAEYNLALPAESSTQLYQFPVSPFHKASDTQTIPLSFAEFSKSPASSASDGVHHNVSNHSVSTASDFKRKKRKVSLAVDVFTQPRNQSTSYGFPNPADHWASLLSEATPEYCSAQTWEVISGQFQTLCLEAGVLAPFAPNVFPPSGVLSVCIAQYFENFHDNFPVIHQPTFGSKSQWLVVLAVAAIGTSFAKASYAAEMREAFQEFLRRAVDRHAGAANHGILYIPLAQARILNLIGLVLSDRQQLRALSPHYHAELSRSCLESGVLQLDKTGDLPNGSTSNGVSGGDLSHWQRWIRIESSRRIGYLSWMLDCALGYMANARPLCNMDDARAPLPCLESAWNAPNVETWSAAVRDIPETHSLCVALERLYSTKKVDPTYSDLSQLLIIHALFQRTWEVGTHIKQPLSEWVPTGKARGFLNTPTKDNFWLPLYPLYANWRNSACDCLDVLHWQASSVVAKASGIEHPLILQLHLARIILLSPFQEIQDLLFSLIGKVDNLPQASYYVHDGSYQPRNSAKLPQIRKITWRWLQEDQHKARLAMVHAGSVFWYVRRYSTMSLFEPLAVYLASILLWTYGSYKSAALERGAAAISNKPEGGPSGPDANAPVQLSRMERKEHPIRFMSKAASSQTGKSSTSTARQNSTTSHGGSNTTPNAETGLGAPSPTANVESESDEDTSSSDERPEFIHLDRPCDDEMVQHFVRNGHNMSGHMTNVGDICKVPNKVLLEGAKLLRTRLACWGVSREYYDILMKLAELRKAS